MWREALLRKGHTKVKEAQWKLCPWPAGLEAGGGVGYRCQRLTSASPQKTGIPRFLPSAETPNHKFSRQDWGMCEYPGRTRGRDRRGSFLPSLETTSALLHMQVPEGNTPPADTSMVLSRRYQSSIGGFGVVQRHPQCIVKTQVLVLARSDHRLRRQ